MTGPEEGEIAGAIRQLAELDAQRLALMNRLVGLGFRSRGLVGEYGEMIVAAYYGVEAAGPSQKGFDLEAEGEQIQVKTLRSTPGNERTSMGVLTEPYSLLFALRLRADFTPKVAYKIPRAVVEAVYPPGTRTSLTKKLLEDSTVKTVTEEELLLAVAALDSRRRRPAGSIVT